MAAKLKAADIIENWPNRLEYTGLEKNADGGLHCFIGSDHGASGTELR